MWPGPDWVGPKGTYTGINFVNFWVAGRLANSGELASGYDQAAFLALVSDWFRPADKFTNLSYPPSLAVFLQPFALLPYLVSLLAWMAASAVAWFVAALGRLPRLGDGSLLLAALVGAPILINNLMFGSIGLFMALLFVSALRLLPANQTAAGILIGLMTVKPQLGVLLPLVLALIGAWRAFVAAVLTALALVAISIVLYGIEPWRMYLTETASLQWSFLETMDGFFALHMTTIYAGLWTLGVSAGAAMIIHWMTALAAAFAVIVVLRSAARWPLKGAVSALGSVMIMPYVLGSDLALPLAALVWTLSDSNVAPTPLGVTATGLLWAVPFPLVFLMPSLGLPLAQIAILLAFAWLVSDALRSKPA
jgi:hypothetical protein